jgi:hypothetical protein
LLGVFSGCYADAVWWKVQGDSFQKVCTLPQFSQMGFGLTEVSRVIKALFLFLWGRFRWLLFLTGYSASFPSMHQMHHMGAPCRNFWVFSGVPVQRARCWVFWIQRITCIVGRISVGPWEEHTAPGLSGTLSRTHWGWAFLLWVGISGCSEGPCSLHSRHWAGALGL